MIEAAILFLDFDGVLWPGRSASFACASLLWAWMYQRPAVQVVVASDWRLSHSLGELRDLFPDELALRIIGTTPDLSAGTQDGEFLFQREREIARWRSSFGARGRHVALDDTAALFSPGYTHLVLTDGDAGLNAADLGRVTAMLGLL